MPNKYSYTFHAGENVASICDDEIIGVLNEVFVGPLLLQDCATVHGEIILRVIRHAYDHGAPSDALNLSASLDRLQAKLSLGE